MASTYTQTHIHVIFTVQNRQSLVNTNGDSTHVLSLQDIEGDKILFAM
ncbi:hypothetical protein [Rhodohalobacter sp.]